MPKDRKIRGSNQEREDRPRHGSRPIPSSSNTGSGALPIRAAGPSSSSSGGPEPEFKVRGKIEDRGLEGVKKVEDQYIKKYGEKKAATTQMAPVLGGGSRTSATKAPLQGGKLFANRPSFPSTGTTGGSGSSSVNVNLLANYFPVKVTLDDNKSRILYSYNLTVSPIETAGSRGASTPKGKKLRAVIKQLLDEILPPSATYATNFKDHVVSPAPLYTLEGFKTVRLAPEWGHTDFRVDFAEPAALELSGLLRYLQTMEPLRPAVPTDGKPNPFTHFQSTLDALGVVFGYAALKHDEDTLAPGRACYFQVGDARARCVLGKDGRPSLLEVGRGFFQSPRLGTNRLLLNVNVTYAIFRQPGNLAQLIRERNLASMSRVGSMSERDRQSYADHLRRLSHRLARARVIYTLPQYHQSGSGRRIYKTLAGFASDAAHKTRKGGYLTKFSKRFVFAAPEDIYFYVDKPDPGPVTGVCDRDGYIQMQKYFTAKYGCNLDRDLPVIHAGDGTYVPAEFCEIEAGNLFNSPLEPDEADVMIKYASRPPSHNAQLITHQGRATLRLENQGDIDHMARFGIAVGDQLITVPGRQLVSPKMEYLKRDSRGGSERVDVEDGRWRLVNRRFLQRAGDRQKWMNAFFRFAPDPAKEAQLEDAIRAFQRNLQDLGVKEQRGYPGGRSIDLDGGILGNFERLRKRITNVLGSISRPPKETVICLVALPDLPSAQRDTLYDAIKIAGDVDLGMHTICMQEKKLLKKDVTIFNNVALKFNLKSGGLNHKMIDGVPLINGNKTMVVGYDVTHPTGLPGSAGDNKAGGGGTEKGKGKATAGGAEEDKENPEPPSHGAMVASIDSALAAWPVSIWVGPSRQEMYSEELKVAIQERLAAWASRDLPTNILIYRDGLSEGQFEQAISMELAAIKEGIAIKYASQGLTRRPRVTFVVSVKRHQTRFYRQKIVGTDTVVDNPAPGTVVDRGITIARHWDFYLQAHKAIQGTARPTHYTVLHDEIFVNEYHDRAAEYLQEVTFRMCSLFGRATTSVSLCPAAYYADIACTRARAHMRELYQNQHQLQHHHHNTGDEGSSRLSEEQRRAILARRVHPNLMNTMYYM